MVQWRYLGQQRIEVRGRRSAAGGRGWKLLLGLMEEGQDAASYTTVAVGKLITTNQRCCLLLNNSDPPLPQQLWSPCSTTKHPAQQLRPPCSSTLLARREGRPQPIVVSRATKCITSASGTLFFSDIHVIEEKKQNNSLLYYFCD